MRSMWENSLWFRVFVLVVWLSLLWTLNFMFFAPFLWFSYGLSLIILTIFLWLLLFYLVKYFRYSYEIKENNLYIKTSNKKKVYKIPFCDIKNVKKVTIPFNHKFWLKFDANRNILYLSWFAPKWILLQLKTHDIVISPRKYELFYEKLKKSI